MHEPRPTSEALLKRLARLHPKLIDLSLDRIERLLARLDHPEQHLAPVIHVAGTNGKGSVIAFLRAMLEAAGYRVQAYTSPHLVHFCERIRLVGGPIAEEALAAVLGDCEAANDGAPITFFEITTAAAFLAFAREPADVVLLEVGLGGRFDATNVIARPKACVITPVSHDHAQFLGTNLAGIAREKAGIIKAGAPVIVAPQTAEAEAVIAQRAAEVQAPMRRFGADWRIEKTPSGFRFEDGAGTLDLPTPALHGDHQIENAGTAIACLREIPDFPVDEAAIAEGLARTRWPARLQRLKAGAFGLKVPTTCEIWLDGGHNPAAGQALARAFPGPAPLDLIVGLMAGKDLGGFLDPLIARARRLCAVPIPNEPGGHAADDIAAYAAAHGLTAHAAPDVPAALHWLARHADFAPVTRVLICGSLYLAGSVLQALER